MVSENWLKALIKDIPIGKQLKCWFPEGDWVICNAFVDFYEEREKFRYFGRLQRFPVPEVEERVYRTILLGLQLGVSWWEVKKNIRWNMNGVEWDQGTNGAECIVEDSKYLEDRRYS